jgi:uncharacterized membrane protein
MEQRTVRALERWRTAGVLDASTAERIRTWEAEHGVRAEGRLAAWVLGIGGLLLSAGILLFVAAHWSELSPWRRFGLLLGTTSLLHIGGALCAARRPETATALHAVGTAAFGGAVFLTGQAFHLQLEWPAGLGLWALGAAAGCALRRDWPHVVWLAVLAPAWLLGEWAAQARLTREHWGGLAFLLAPLAIAYLAAPKPGSAVAWRDALARLGAVAVVPAAIFQACVGWDARAVEIGAPGFVVVLLVPALLAFVLRGAAGWPAAAAALFCSAIFALERASSPAWCVYLLHLIAALAVVGWGVRESSRLRANVGTLGAATAIVFFYFSSVFDKLGRSLGLIGLGLLFIGGGYALERARRSVVRHIEEARA